MTQKEKIVKLLEQADKEYMNMYTNWILTGMGISIKPSMYEIFANYLIDNKVIVLPCNPYEDVYVLEKEDGHIWEGYLNSVHVYKGAITIGVSYTGEPVYHEMLASDIGKRVFFTREEAEAARNEGGWNIEE